MVTSGYWRGPSEVMDNSLGPLLMVNRSRLNFEYQAMDVAWVEERPQTDAVVARCSTSRRGQCLRRQVARGSDACAEARSTKAMRSAKLQRVPPRRQIASGIHDDVSSVASRFVIDRQVPVVDFEIEQVHGGNIQPAAVG